MALFLSADIHQGDERFRVHSRGKQCAFMSLAALLTARNIPLNLWSRITFNNASLQGDIMFLDALDSGFIILDPGVGFLSVENLPTVVNVVCCTNLLNDFSYEICQTSVQAKTTASCYFEAQNNITETQTCSNDLTIQSKTTSPMKVTNRTSPMMVTNTKSPMKVTDIDLPIVVEPVEAQIITEKSPMKVTDIDLPIVVEPVEAKIITDIHDDTENENQICLINYGAEFQGFVITDQEIASHYYDIHTALLNTFKNDNYAILILEGYMMALVKQTDNFYLFDSHARDSFEV
jgi:hypothetical protein